MRALWDTVWTVWTNVQARWEVLRRDPDAGYSTETVVVTALLVVLALVVIGIIAAEVTNRAESIQF